jgi:alpha-2-macroglobulin
MIFTRDDRFPVRLASASEIEAETLLHRQVEAAPADRHVVLRPAHALPAGGGTSCRRAERRLARGTSGQPPESSTSRSAPPARSRLDRHQCGDLRHPCRPGDRWYLAFSNPLNPDAWSDDLVQVSPAVEGLSIYLTPTGLTLLGATRARTTYTVRLDPGIRDVFGNGLGQEEVIRIQVEDAEPHIAIAGAPLVVLDPAGGTRLRVQTRNVERFQRAPLRGRAGGLGRIPGGPPAATAAGRPRAVHASGPSGGLVHGGRRGHGVRETVVDLSPALTGDLGQVIVVVDPPAGETDGADRSRHGCRRPASASPPGSVPTRSRRASPRWRRESLSPASRCGSGPSGGESVTDAAGLCDRAPPRGVGGPPHRPAWRGSRPPRARRTAASRSPPGSGGPSIGCAGRSSPIGGSTVPGRRFDSRGGFGRWKAGVISASPTLWTRWISSLVGPRREEVGEGSAVVTPQGGGPWLGGASRGDEPGPCRGPSGGDREPPSGEGLQYRAGFQVQEYRRPEYEVHAEADPGPHLMGDRVQGHRSGHLLRRWGAPRCRGSLAGAGAECQPSASRLGRVDVR